jgi:hypothetical protein
MRSALTGFLVTALAAAGCSGQVEDGSNLSAVKESIAAQIVAANADADHTAHLLGRQLSSDGNEVIEFYEPAPGQLMLSTAGLPAKASAFAPSNFAGQTIAEVWHNVAPNAAMPKELARFADNRLAKAPAKSASVVRSVTPDSDYCSDQFFSDYASYYTSHGRVGGNVLAIANLINGTDKFITGDHGTGFRTAGNSMHEVDAAVCDAASGTGGTFSFFGSNGSSVTWSVPAGTLRSRTTWTSDNCGWDGTCLFQGDYRCTPGPSFSASVDYYPNLAAVGSESGDSYGFISGYFQFCSGCTEGCGGVVD